MSEESEEREEHAIEIEWFGKQSFIEKEHYSKGLSFPICKGRIGTYLEEPCHAL